MTISSPETEWSYVGDDVTRNFGYHNLAFAASDVKVAFDGVVQPSANYVVTGVDNEEGGEAVFNAGLAPPDQVGVLVFLDPPDVQDAEYTIGDPFPSKRHERALDRRVIRSLIDGKEIVRAARFPRGENLDGILPALAERANKLAVWDALGNWAAGDLVDPGSVVISGYWQGVLPAANAAASRILLGLEGAASVTDAAFAGGADKTGAADSTAAFQACVDSGEGMFLIPAGTYKKNGTVNCYRPVRFIGAGIDICTIHSDLDTNDFFHVTADSVVLEGFDMVGTAGRMNPGQGRGIVIGPVERSVSDGAISATNTNFSSATANFTAGDVDSHIFVAGAYTTNKTPTIAVVVDPQNVTLSDPADVTVTGAAATIAYVPRNVIVRNVATARQSIGVAIVNGQDVHLDTCFLHAYWSLSIGNVAPEIGDHTLSYCRLASDKQAGQHCVEWRSGGGPRFIGCHFFSADDAFTVSWEVGNGRGPVISGCLFADIAAAHIRLKGNSAAEMLTGNIGGNVFVDGTEPIIIEDTVKVIGLDIAGNSFVAAAAGKFISLGALVDSISIGGNTFDGQGFAGSTAISVGPNAQGVQIGLNTYRNLTTRVSDQSGKAKIARSAPSNPNVIDLTNGGANDLTLVDWINLGPDLDTMHVTIAGGSLSGTDEMILQLGHGGGPTFEVAGYTGSIASSSGATSNSAGFYLMIASAAANTWDVTVTLRRIAGTNDWVCGVTTGGGGNGAFGGGMISLPGEATAVRLTTFNGVDTFDAGVGQLETDF